MPLLRFGMLFGQVIGQSYVFIVVFVYDAVSGSL